MSLHVVEVTVVVKVYDEPRKFPKTQGEAQPTLRAIEQGVFNGTGDSKAAAITEALEAAVVYTDQISGDVKPAAILRSV